MAENLAGRDLRALIGVVRSGEPTEAMPWNLLNGLVALVRCDARVVQQVEPCDNRGIVLQWVEGDDRCLELGDDDLPLPPEFRRYAKEFLRCNSPRRTGDLARVVR
jgi:hypothetical protein